MLIIAIDNPKVFEYIFLFLVWQFFLNYFQKDFPQNYLVYLLQNLVFYLMHQIQYQCIVLFLVEYCYSHIFTQAHSACFDLFTAIPSNNLVMYQFLSNKNIIIREHLLSKLRYYKVCICILCNIMKFIISLLILIMFKDRLLQNERLNKKFTMAFQNPIVSNSCGYTT